MQVYMHSYDKHLHFNDNNQKRIFRMFLTQIYHAILMCIQLSI